MSETEDFLASVLPRLTAADTALHNGDAAARKALWSTTDPVTLFGAAMMTTGWPEIEATFDWLATRFSDCSSFDIEVVAAGISGDLAPRRLRTHDRLDRRRPQPPTRFG